MLGALFLTCILLLRRVKDELHMSSEMIAHFSLFAGVLLPVVVVQLYMENGRLPLNVISHVPVCIAQLVDILITFVFTR